MRKEIVNNSFVFYATNLEVIEALEETNKELAADFMRAVIEYGIYGEYDTINPMVKVLMVQAGFGIDKAKDRYAASVENGKKGGRPKIELDEEEVLLKKQELKTWKAVAAFYGITEQSLKNKRNEWELNKNEKNPKNLNDNDNDNIKEIDNIVELDSEIQKSDDDDDDEEFGNSESFSEKPKENSEIQKNFSEKPKENSEIQKSFSEKPKENSEIQKNFSEKPWRNNTLIQNNTNNTINNTIKEKKKEKEERSINENEGKTEKLENLSAAAVNFTNFEGTIGEFYDCLEDNNRTDIKKAIIDRFREGRKSNRFISTNNVVKETLSNLGIEFTGEIAQSM